MAMHLALNQWFLTDVGSIPTASITMPHNLTAEYSPDK